MNVLRSTYATGMIIIIIIVCLSTYDGYLYLWVLTYVFLLIFILAYKKLTKPKIWIWSFEIREIVFIIILNENEIFFVFYIPVT